MVIVMTAKMKKDVIDVQRPSKKILRVMQKCFVFFVTGITLHLPTSVLGKNLKERSLKLLRYSV